MFDKLTSSLFESAASTFYSARNGIERARAKSWAELHKFFDTVTGVIGTDKKSTSQQLAEFQSWIYIITTTIYGRTSSLEWGLFVDRGTEKSTRLNEHPVIDLLKKPNDFMTGSFLQQYTQLQLDLTGKAFILKKRNGATLPGELWPISTDDFVRFELGDTNKDFLQGYTFRDKNGGTLTFPPSEIIYLHYPHPVDLIDGASPVQAMARIADIEKYVEIYEKTFFENSARPDIILSMKGDTKGSRSEQAANRVLERWREKHAGPRNFHEPTVLTNMEVTTLNATNKDFEFSTLAGWTGDMLAAAYSMPKGKLFPEKINRANGYMIEQTFNRDCIAPRIALWDEAMTNNLAAEFDSRLIVKHDNPVPADQAFDLKKDESDLKNIVNTVNEVRERRGHKPVEWGDKPWAPFNLVQINEDNDSRNDKPEEDEAKAPTLYGGTEKQGKNRFLDSEEKRVNYWKQFDRRTENQAKKFREPLRKLFSQQEKEVLRNLKKVAPKLDSKFSGWRPERVAFEIKQDPKLINDILFDQKEWEEKFVKVGKPHIQNSVDTSGKSVMVDLGVDATFDVQDARAAKFIEEQSLTYAKQVNTTTRKKLRKTLTEGFKAGESIPKLSKRIRDVYDIADKTRSTVTARTEIIGASNFGSLDGMKQSGVVQKKEWLTSKDDRVRDAHDFMDGETVGINELFSPGDGDVQYPQSIQERCTVIPVVSASA